MKWQGEFIVYLGLRGNKFQIGHFGSLFISSVKDKKEKVGNQVLRVCVYHFLEKDFYTIFIEANSLKKNKYFEQAPFKRNNNNTNL